jgi:hypothetical protein
VAKEYCMVIGRMALTPCVMKATGTPSASGDDLLPARATSQLATQKHPKKTTKKEDTWHRFPEHQTIVGDVYGSVEGLSLVCTCAMKSHDKVMSLFVYTCKGESP